MNFDLNQYELKSVSGSRGRNTEGGPGVVDFAEYSGTMPPGAPVIFGIPEGMALIFGGLKHLPM